MIVILFFVPGVNFKGEFVGFPFNLAIIQQNHIKFPLAPFYTTTWSCNLQTPLHGIYCHKSTLVEHEQQLSATVFTHPGRCCRIPRLLGTVHKCFMQLSVLFREGLLISMFSQNSILSGIKQNKFVHVSRKSDFMQHPPSHSNWKKV